MSVTEQLIAELRHEAATTRRVIERLPEEKLTWQPHPKSMKLGELAMHIAMLPHGIAELLSETVREAPVVPRVQPQTVAEIVAKLGETIDHAAGKLTEWGDEGLKETWRLVSQGQTLVELPRGVAVRNLMMNHAYHHRGQLTVYLRLLDVPLPSVYGPTADEVRF